MEDRPQLLKYLFAPDEEIPKTALATITRWVVALTDFNSELRNTTRQQIHQADALSLMDFDANNSDNYWMFSAINNIYFAQSDLVNQADIKNELGTNKFFHGIKKRIKGGNWKQFSELVKEYEQQKDALNIHNRFTVRGFVHFITPKIQNLFLAKTNETHPWENATEASVKMMACWLGIKKDSQHFLCKCRSCRLNTGLAWEKFSLQGQKPTSRISHTWATLGSF